MDPSAGPTDRAPTAPAVGHAAQNSLSGLRPNAARPHTAAEERRPHDQHDDRRRSHGMRRLDGVEPLELLARSDQATAVRGAFPADPRLRGLYTREYLSRGGAVGR